MSAPTLTAPRADLPDVAPPVSSPRHRRRAPDLDVLFTAVFALFGFGVGIGRLSDNSFFWHLRAGRYILDNGFPHGDVFSYTAPGAKWVVQSWLAEVTYAGLDRVIGPFGIRLLGACTGAAIAVLVFRLALRLAHERVRAALVSVAALGGLSTIWSERPLLLGVLWFCVLIWVVEVPDGRIGRHPVVVLPPLFWLWANWHGSFALGFVYLGLHLAGRWLDGARPWRGRERSLLVGSALAVVVILANPYGVDLLVFPVHLVRRGDILRHVVEWGSPDFHTIQGYAFALWIAVFACVLARGRTRVSRRDVVVAVPFLGLGLWALRNIAIAPLVGLPVVARSLALDPVPRDRAEDVHAVARGERSPVVAWTALGLITVVAASLGVSAAGERDFSFQGYPVAALRAVEARGLLGRRLLADDADAGYVILRYGRRQPVFIDDRYDMYPRRVILDFLALNDGDPTWQRILDRRGVEVVVWRRRAPLTQYLRQSTDWREVHRDPHDLVFVRADLIGSGS